MKNLFLILLAATVTFTSCNKEAYEGSYDQVEDVAVEDTTEWDSGYTNGGTLPTTTQNNDDGLDSTTWVLTKLVSSFATEYPNDTIHFVNSTQYTLNGGAVRTYQLAGITSSTNKELSFYYFAPFGGSHYSGQVGLYFIEDGELNNIEFKDVQNSTKTIRAWFTKIN